MLLGELEVVHLAAASSSPKVRTRADQSAALQDLAVERAEQIAARHDAEEPPLSRGIDDGKLPEVAEPELLVHARQRLGRRDGRDLGDEVLGDHEVRERRVRRNGSLMSWRSMTPRSRPVFVSDVEIEAARLEERAHDLREAASSAARA